MFHVVYGSWRVLEYLNNLCIIVSPAVYDADVGYVVWNTLKITSKFLKTALMCLYLKVLQVY